MSVLAGVPVKRFYVAKQRLSPVLSRRDRSRLGKDLAGRTLEAVRQAGAEPVVLAADQQVARWALGRGAASLVDRRGGLDDAAAGLVAQALAAQRPWLVVHADLPLVTPDDIRQALKILAAGESPIAPSDDGGTSLLGGRGAMDFSYGPASFHRHIARMASGRVLIRLGLSLDLDDSADLTAARSHHRGAWLGRYAVGS